MIEYMIGISLVVLAYYLGWQSGKRTLKLRIRSDILKKMEQLKAIPAIGELLSSMLRRYNEM